MRVWLITIGEPVPTNGTNMRLLRTAMLAEALVEKGHKVTWWTSSFNHGLKHHRYQADTVVDINSRYRIWFLHAVKYSKNISFRRLLNHLGVGRKFSKLATKESIPDVVLCSFPPPALCLAATRYCIRQNVPVVLDIRDLWPDFMFTLVPTWARPFASGFLWPMARIVRHACMQATAICGISQSFVEWGVDHADRSLNALDREFPLGYAPNALTDDDKMKAEIFWDEQGIGTRENEFIACYFGMMGDCDDMKIVIEAAKKIQNNSRRLRFVLCGTGDNFKFYKQLAYGCDNVHMPGWVGRAEILTLLKRSSTGLVPIFSHSNDHTLNAVPNKSIEYLSSGLPILSSLKGNLEDLLSTYNCGFTFESGNADQLVSKLFDLYDRHDLWETMSTNASTLFKDKFIANKVFSSMIGYLKEVKRSIQKDPR